MKNKLLTLLIILSLTISFGVSAVFADDEISEENMQLSVNAYRRGVKMMQMKAYDSAVSAFEEAIDYNPNLSDAYYNIASICIQQQKIDEAYQNYVKAIAVNPRDYGSILQAAKISYNRKNYSLVLKYLDNIPEDYEKYYVVKQLRRDAQEQFDTQKNRIERSKLSTAVPNKRVIIDKFESPAGMVVDSDGNMYVASYSDNAIVKVDINKNKSNFVKDYLLDGPVGLAIDRFDNIYVANFEADNILKITKGGNVSIFMDKVSKPYFLYIKDDILYISEQGNDVVLTYNLNTSSNK